MWSWKAADFPLCCNSVGFPETQIICNENSNNNNNKNLRKKKKGNMIFTGGKCPGLILTLFPTYLIQLPVLSFTSSHLSLSLAAQNFLHHLVPQAITISPLSSCACILPDLPSSTLVPFNISQPKAQLVTPLLFSDGKTLIASPDSQKWVPKCYIIWEVSYLMSLQPLVTQD